MKPSTQSPSLLRRAADPEEGSPCRKLAVIHPYLPSYTWPCSGNHWNFLWTHWSWDKDPGPYTTPEYGHGAPVSMPSSGNYMEVSLPTLPGESPVNLGINTIKTFITLYFLHIKDYL